MDSLRRTSQSIALILITLLVLVLPETAVASLVVSSWSLLTFTEDASSDLPVDDFVRFTEVQSPFQATANTAVGLNTASTAYDFSWSGDSGSFDVDIALNVETLRVRSLSTGIIFISPTTDLRMSIDASLDFASVPGDLADIGFRMKVLDATTFAAFFRENRAGGNFNFEPAVGTLTISGDVILPAGTTYRIDFGAGADTSIVDNPSGPVTASGFIHFDFRPIPEPATAWLIVLGAIAWHRPRQRTR